MNNVINLIEQEQMKKEIPQFSVGDTVQVHYRIKEGTRERIQVFEGIVLKKQGGSNRATFTVRRISYGVGVERTFALHSPRIEKLVITRRGQVRKAKLNYLRQRLGKSARVKEKKKY